MADNADDIARGYNAVKLPRSMCRNMSSCFEIICVTWFSQMRAAHCGHKKHKHNSHLFSRPFQSCDSLPLLFLAILEQCH